LSKACDIGSKGDFAWYNEDVTNDDKERLLGRVLMGLSTETALASLGVDSSDYFEEIDRDAMFRDTLNAAQAMRDALERMLD
jgi:hypothetical protein